MRNLIIPLLLLVILADVYCRWNYSDISDSLYYIGEPIVYFVWVSAFILYVKFTVTELQKKTITIILFMWLPFCLNAIYRQATGIGHKNDPVDLYTGFLSGILILTQVLIWKRK